MSISASYPHRDGSSRWLSAGPSAANRATMLAAALSDHEGHKIARVVIDKAVAGDPVAARFVIGHLTPRPRGRAIALDMPDGARAGDTVAAFNATLLAMAAGEITPDEALTVTRVFDGRFKALKAWEIERFLTRWDPIPGDELFYAYGEEEEAAEEEDGEDEEVLAEARTEPSPLGPFDIGSGGQGEGALPANHLHLGESPHPDPLPRGEGEVIAETPRELSPSGSFDKHSGGQGGGGSPANHLHSAADPQPDRLPENEGEGAAQVQTPAPEPALAGLHSACIQPSPATIAGRRRVAELVRRQWERELS